jgi:broad specificity phosphatase PhoE
MRLLLVPHAPTDWNATERLQGWTDTPLSEAGKRQAALLAGRLSRERIDVCHASDLRRAVDTAAAIGADRHLVITPDPRLRELHFGDWEGLTYQQTCQLDFQAVLAWETDPMQAAPPGGETLAQLAERVAAFLDAVTGVGRLKFHTALVVAHRGTLRVLLCLLLGLPPTAWWEFRLEPASVSELELFSKGAVLNYLNDTHHLKETANAG